uniref:G-protein coupled receptors family 1 profile domain-containing protein n=1 Tax=Ascaris lumbricoides TaxID=6252 RepID=A0A9J2P2L7_ASCLU
MESTLLLACNNISLVDSCHVLNLSNSQPLWLARPIYGLAAPIIILVTLITNSLVVLVLSHRNLRTPTNHILLAMAVAELMTGLSSCPWFIYYYTLGGFLTDQHEGLNEFWCRFHSYFAVHFPTIFHTTAIWLTVFLAIQRYVYVCVPSIVCKYCNPVRTRQMIAIIVLAALVNEVPLMLFQSSVSLKLSQQSRLCIRLYAPLIEQVPFGSELMKVKFEQLISCSVPFPYLSVIKMYPMIFCI